MMACTVHYDLYFGLDWRYLTGKCSGKWHDMEEILNIITRYVSISNREHIKWIRTTGCPLESKLTIISHIFHDNFICLESPFAYISPLRMGVENWC